MNRFFTCYGLALAACFTPIFSHGANEGSTREAQSEPVSVVTVATPGTLEESILDHDDLRITNLKIIGSLNSTDLIYLQGCKGKLANVTTLDLSETTLTDDPTPYAKVKVQSSDVGMGGTYNTYYISSEYKFEQGPSGTTGLGGNVYNNYIGINDFSGVFAGYDIVYTNVILPDLERVGEYLFKGNKTIQSVTIADRTTTIGIGAFDQAVNLTTANLPDNLISIEDYAFRGTTLSEITLPSSVTHIGSYAFSNYSTWSGELDFSNVEYVGAHAFESIKLTGTLDLRKLTEVPDYAFYAGVYDTILFGEDLERIGSSAFAASINVKSNLTEIQLPKSLKMIAIDSFNGTPWQESLKGEDDGIIYINNIAFRPDASYPFADGVLSFREGTTAISEGNWNFYIPKRDYLKNVITTIVLPESLEEIGNLAFKEFSKIGDIVFPKNLKKIGNNAFEYCTSLWFEDIPDGIETIGDRAFANCSKLTQITFWPSLKSVGSGAFTDCSGIVKVALLAKHLETTGLDCSGIDTIVIGSEVENIPKSAFSSASNARKVTFEERSESTPLVIRDNAFYCCSNAKFINMPLRIDSIGKSAFCGCNGITEFNPEYCKYIGTDAFSYCNSLQEITLPSSVQSIGHSAFFDREENATYPSRTIEYNCINATTDGVVFGTVPVSKLIIGPDVESLGHHLFRTPINEIEFAERSKPSVPFTIGDYCFYSSNLSEINVPTNLTRIGNSAFGYCSFTGLQIPEGIEYIGKEAFAYSSLTDLYIYAATPPETGGQLTDSYHGVTVHVPAKSLADYQEAAWARCTFVPMEQLVESITIEPEEATLSVGESITLSATILPDIADNREVIWLSSDESVVSVDADGVVTAVSEGEATITATTTDGSELSASSIITVTNSFSRIDEVEDYESIEIYDIQGCKLENKNLLHGVYFIKSKGNVSKIII